MQKAAPAIALDGQSEGEAAFDFYLRTLGSDLPSFEREWPLPEGNRSGEEQNKPPFRADFAWPAEKVIFEVQGYGHERTHKYRKDLVRHNLLTSWGYKVFYATPDQIKDNPEAIISLLRVVLTVRNGDS